MYGSGTLTACTFWDGLGLVPPRRGDFAEENSIINWGRQGTVRWAFSGRVWSVQALPALTLFGRKRLPAVPQRNGQGTGRLWPWASWLAGKRLLLLLSLLPFPPHLLSLSSSPSSLRHEIDPHLLLLWRRGMEKEHITTPLGCLRHHPVS